jgi:alpha-galactosidase
MRSHFALWAMMASPLIAGNDLRSADQATMTILKNQNLITINQDSLGLQATQVSNDGTRRVLAKKLSNGDVAVALFNQGSSTITTSTTASALGLSGGAFTLREAWSNTSTTTTGTISASVPAHGTVVYRVSGTGSPSSSAIPSSSASVSAPASASASSSAGQCKVKYAVSGQWQGGFQTEVTITNPGVTAVNGWTLRWSFADGQRVSQAWNTTLTQSGAQVTAVDVAYNAAIAPAGTANFGFISSWTGTNSSPSLFTLNETACAAA